MACATNAAPELRRSLHASPDRPPAHAIYQVTPAILGRRRATQHPPVRPVGRQKVNESARRQPEDLPAASDATARRANSLTKPSRCPGSEWAFARGAVGRVDRV